MQGVTSHTDLVSTLVWHSAGVSSLLETGALATLNPIQGFWPLGLLLNVFVAEGSLASMGKASVGHPSVAPQAMLLRAALITQVQLAALAMAAVSISPAQQLSQFSLLTSGFTTLLESVDPLMLMGELLAVLLIFSLFGAFKARAQALLPGYDDLVTLCQLRGVSIAEVFGLISFALGFVFFDAFVSLAEEDSLEAISYLFAVVILAAVILLVVAVDVHYYFLVSSISGGELTLRVLYTDLVNNALCLLRIFFCWVRYIFYDLQAELVDFAFHYTELGDELALEATHVEAQRSLWTGVAYLAGGLLWLFFDCVSVLVQVLIGTFKLVLALFLFWLILDLFLLRTLAHAEASRALAALRLRRQSPAGS